MSGELFTCSKIYTEWKISDFSRGYLAHPFLWSPSFCVLNVVWHVIIRFYSSEGRMFFQISLITEYGAKTITVDFTLGIKDSNPSIKYGPETKTFMPSTEWHHEERYFIDELPVLLKNYVEDDTLTIYFEVINQSTTKDAGSQCSPLYSTYISCGDISDLLHDGQNTDVRITVSGQEFKAHKLILQTRSPIFEAMFRHGMKEATEGVVKIEDCDPIIFQQFLQCLYTGKLENVLPENVASLYIVADKYCVKEIQEKCAIYMAEYLSVDTACDVLALSDKYGEIDLKNSAEQFLIQNIKAILPTDKWKSLMIDHSELTSQILWRVVESGINANAEDA